MPKSLSTASIDGVGGCRASHYFLGDRCGRPALTLLSVLPLPDSMLASLYTSGNHQQSQGEAR
jgi:hypothetical protein